MFSLRDGSKIVTVPNALNFSEIPLTYGMTTVPWYTVSGDGLISCRCLYYRANEFLWVFTEHQVMSCGFNFVVKILLILTYDLRSVDQIMGDSPFYTYVGGWT
jgi:hypothetical protein